MPGSARRGRAHRVVRAAPRGRCCRTIRYLDTPLKNPADEALPDIAVTDPRHPLYGRRFPLLSVSQPPLGDGHVFVRYRDVMVLRLPVAATTLASSRPAPATVLTHDGVVALVTLVEQDEGLCQRDPPTCGRNSPPSCAPESVTNSPPSARR